MSKSRVHNRPHPVAKSNQAGSILVEMTLAMPILLIAGLNMFDLWHYMSHKQIAVESARAGGRWAAATQIAHDTLSDGADAYSFPMRCDHVLDAMVEDAELLALDAKTARYTCQYLQSSGLKTMEWRVNPAISETTEVTPSLFIQTIDVEVQQEINTCVGCVRQFTLSPPKASARYNLPFPDTL